MTCRTTSSAKWTTMIIQYRHRWNIYLKNTKASCQVDDLNAPIPDVVLSEQHKRVIVKNWKKNLQRTTPRARTSPKWPVCFVPRARDAKPQRSVYSTWTPALNTCIPARKRSQRANWTQLGLQLANFSSESVLFDFMADLQCEHCSWNRRAENWRPVQSSGWLCCWVQPATQSVKNWKVQIPSQKIDSWKERLCNDLLCVRRDVKPPRSRARTGRSCRAT